MRGRVAAAALTMSVLVLAGCSGDEADQPLESVPPQSSPARTTTEPSTTSEPAPTTSAAPTGAPALPPEAEEQTPDGAAAFVQHWFDTLEYSWEVMDSAPLRNLGECLTCVAFADTIDDVLEDGHRLDGGDFTIKSIAPNAVLADGSSSATVLFDTAEQRILQPDGTLVDVLGPLEENAQFFFDLAWSGSAWIVTSVRLIAS